MTTEKVYSPIRDNNIKNNISSSPIWKNCYHEDELKDIPQDTRRSLICYTIKFDGLKPIQVTNIK